MSRTLTSPLIRNPSTLNQVKLKQERARKLKVYEKQLDREYKDGMKRTLKKMLLQYHPDKINSLRSGDDGIQGSEEVREGGERIGWGASRVRWVKKRWMVRVEQRQGQHEERFVALCRGATRAMASDSVLPCHRTWRLSSRM